MARVPLVLLLATAHLLIAGTPVPYVSVRDFGATGDGRTLDTAAINQAIAFASAQGGSTVVFPAGTYASYSIHLKSNVELYLEAGSTILAADPPCSGQPGGYDPPEPNQWDKYQDFGHSHWQNSLIWGEDISNVSITGPGRIFGRGLSKGHVGEPKDPLPGEPRPPGRPRQVGTSRDPVVTPGPFGYPNSSDTLPAGLGNKAIALKNCRNVIFRDFTVFHGGHFAILGTGVDNWTCDNLKIDTNRDGIDIDCCQNVRVSNCTINSPFDDGICPKSSFALGYNRATQNVTVVNCQMTGYVEGTLLNGTYGRRPRGSEPTGRFKLGTEANGGFKNITVANCVLESCRGIALEEVDGGSMEDITISNITMRDICNAPIFIRLGARQRAPDTPKVGAARRIIISNIVATQVSSNHGILVAGLPGHPIEGIILSNIHISYEGGGTMEQAQREVPEYEDAYPEPSHFGVLPAYGIFARHVRALTLRDVEFALEQPDHRPAFFVQDAENVFLDHITVPRAADAPTLELRDVTGLAIINFRPFPDVRKDGRVAKESM
jgi:polygalacturonase